MEQIKVSKNRFLVRLIGDDWSIILVQADSVQSVYQRLFADGISPSQVATVCGPVDKNYDGYGELVHL